MGGCCLEVFQCGNLGVGAYKLRVYINQIYVEPDKGWET